MDSGATAVPVVRDLKDLLQIERQEIEALHRGGVLGVQVSSALVDLYDRVVQRAYQEALARADAPLRARILNELVLVAIGGYGRAELSPYSDLDILFLHAPRPHPVVVETASALVRDLWDVGLKLGSSIRPPSQALSFVRTDLSFCTALMESRYVAGNPDLLADVQARLLRRVQRLSVNRYIDRLLAERSKEHRDYHAPTVKLLEPNVKKSPGGLRDLHLMRWVALPRYGTRDSEMLHRTGVLNSEDRRTILDGGEFLTRVRHELHFHAGGAQDVLTREEQLRVAEWLGFKDEGGRLGVERFMQQYYRHTTGIHEVVRRFIAGARHRSVVRRAVDRILAQRVGDHFLLDREKIAIDPRADDSVTGRADVIVELVDLARQHGVSVAHETVLRVRREDASWTVTPRSRQLFLRLMSNPLGLAGALRMLHSIGILGRLIPAFEHARCLMQYNQYHKYTVDEHSIRAVEAAQWRSGERGPIGRLYRDCKRKDVLHLAILLHDVGKGYEEDHSEVGRRIAEETAGLFGFGELERHLLVFLVHKHLAMAHVATRRDVSDDRTVLQFAREVGTVEALRMMLLLTVADTEAVAPGSLTAWKESLFLDLYRRAEEVLTGGDPVNNGEDRAKKVRADIRKRLSGELPEEWLATQLEAMPPSYLLTTAAATVDSHLRALKEITPGTIRVIHEMLPDGPTQFTVFAREGEVDGLFEKITGALAAERFSVIAASIVTRADGLVLDTFRAVDRDHGSPSAYRRQEVAERIEAVLRGEKTVEQLFEGRSAYPRPEGPRSPWSTQVEIDNTSSDRFTVIEVFSDERPGLLYRLAQTIHGLGLSIASAKIATRLDQAVDVFFVTDADGRKVEDPERLEEIRKSLLKRVGSL